MPRVLLGDQTKCRVVAPADDKEFDFYFVDEVAKALFNQARFVAHEATDDEGAFFAVGDTENIQAEPEIVMITNDESKYDELLEYYEDQGDIIIWVHQDRE